MGMYTEFMLQGQLKKNIPENIKEIVNYFFDENSKVEISNSLKNNLPDHDFFKLDGWWKIGYMSSFYFSPFSLRYTDVEREYCGTHVFLLCNIKNYNDDIEKFLDWIDPYMEHYWGHFWYEEDEQPTFFKVRR